MNETNSAKEVYIIEPFYGGSHKQLIDFLKTHILQTHKIHLFTLPAKKWHWRARTSALYFAQTIPKIDFVQDKTDRGQEGCTTLHDAFLFCSSVLNLAELISLRPDLAKICQGRKLIYFHENQLSYPIKKDKGERDFQYGYNQVLSALVADKVIFNSHFNFSSFTDNLSHFFKLQPDFRPSIPDIKDAVTKKSTVLHFPIDIPNNIPPTPTAVKREGGGVLHIVWPHRWEHDKNPEAFFDCLFQLHESGYDFKVSVLGETFSDVPLIFEKAKHVLSDKILHFGRLDSKQEYFDVLGRADVVVSTAFHEFFGVAVIEAAIIGCYPLVPQRLVYPEVFSCHDQEIFYYRTDQQMYKKLKEFCIKPYLPKVKWTRESALKLCQKYSLASDLPLKYTRLFE